MLLWWVGALPLLLQGIQSLTGRGGEMLAGVKGKTLWGLGFHPGHADSGSKGAVRSLCASPSTWSKSRTRQMRVAEHCQKGPHVPSQLSMSSIPSQQCFSALWCALGVLPALSSHQDHVLTPQVTDLPLYGAQETE